MINLHCSRNLKRFLNIMALKEEDYEHPFLWYADTFEVLGKPSVIFMHSTSLYAVVVFDFNPKNVSLLTEVFTEAFIRQLYDDKILQPEEEAELRDWLGSLVFGPEENNPGVWGSMRAQLYDMTVWKDLEKPENAFKKIEDYARFSTNTIPLKAMGYRVPSEVMKEVLAGILN